MTTVLAALLTLANVAAAAQHIRVAVVNRRRRRLIAEHFVPRKSIERLL